MQIFGSDERKLLYKKHIWNRQVFSKERRIVCLKKGLHFLDGIFFVGRTWNNSKHVSDSFCFDKDKSRGDGTARHWLKYGGWRSLHGWQVLSVDMAEI